MSIERVSKVIIVMLNLSYKDLLSAWFGYGGWRVVGNAGIFYTIDRARTLSSGQILSLFRNEVSEEPYCSFLNSLFPDGISLHGRQYIENSDCLFESKEGSLELYFEEVRRARYSGLPSRFESIFCCETIEDAVEMRNVLGDSGAPIYEIYSARVFHRANMVLLNNTGSILVLSHRAHDYWLGVEGSTGQSPIWEIMAKLPVEVGKLIR